MATESGAQQHHKSNETKDADVWISASVNSTMLPPGMEGSSMVESFATDVAYPSHEGFASGEINGTTLPSTINEEPVGRPVPVSYPRTITAMQLLEEHDDGDDDDPFCGPPVDDQDEHIWENRAQEVWDIGTWDSKVLKKTLASLKMPATTSLKRETADIAQAKSDMVEAAISSITAKLPQGEEATAARRELESVDTSTLIRPPGNLKPNQKFICVLPVCLEDDMEFCLVKRILGKGGNNMRRIADECNAKVRLRGIGSGFKEGTEKQEADMPLQLNLSCTEYSKYADAVGRLATLLQDLFRHYKRYAKSKQMDIPDLKIVVEELRRDDILGFKGGDELSAEAGFFRGTSSQAARESEQRSSGKKTTAAENSEMERERRAEEERARRRREATDLLSVHPHIPVPSPPAVSSSSGLAEAAGAAAPPSAASSTVAAPERVTSGKGAGGSSWQGSEASNPHVNSSWGWGSGEAWDSAGSEAWQQQGWNEQSSWRRQAEWSAPASSWSSSKNGWWS